MTPTDPPQNVSSPVTEDDRAAAAILTLMQLQDHLDSLETERFNNHERRWALSQVMHSVNEDERKSTEAQAHAELTAQSHMFLIAYQSGSWTRDFLLENVRINRDRYEAAVRAARSRYRRVAHRITMRFVSRAEADYARLNLQRDQVLQQMESVRAVAGQPTENATDADHTGDTTEDEADPDSADQEG